MDQTHPKITDKIIQSKLSLKAGMRLSIIFTIFIFLLTTTVQSLTTHKRDSAKNFKAQFEQNFEKNSSRNQVFEHFSRCQKLRLKLMIKRRNKPRLLRRIANLSL